MRARARARARETTFWGWVKCHVLDVIFLGVGQMSSFWGRSNDLIWVYLFLDRFGPRPGPPPQCNRCIQKWVNNWGALGRHARAPTRAHAREGTDPK